MTRIETELYVLRRKDTGEYFHSNPRVRHWTNDLKMASFYPRNGIKSLRGNVAGDTGAAHGIEKVSLKDLEIVRVKVVEDAVVNL